MAVVRKQIALRIKGSLAEREDFWRLCYDLEAERFFVEHEWDHMNPYKLGEGGSRGTTEHSVEDWIANKGEGFEKIEEARAEILKEANA